VSYAPIDLTKNIFAHLLTIVKTFLPHRNSKSASSIFFTWFMLDQTMRFLCSSLFNSFYPSLLFGTFCFPLHVLLESHTPSAGSSVLISFALCIEYRFSYFDRSPVLLRSFIDVSSSMSRVSQIKLLMIPQALFIHVVGFRFQATFILL